MSRVRYSVSPRRSLRAPRLWVGGVVAAAVVLVGWSVWSSRPPVYSAEEAARGKVLFEHEWTAHDPLSAGGDGLGPLFNAKSCAACHFQGGVGGGGPNKFNVVAFEVWPRPDDAQMHFGVIHADSVNAIGDKLSHVQRLFPKFTMRTSFEPHCFYSDPTFDPVVVHSLNTPALFGAGLMDRIPDHFIESISHSQRVHKIGQELSGKFDSGVGGQARILSGGRVGKFGWKAQFATLEEFVAAACAMEIGLTNRSRKQIRPLQYKEDTEAQLDLSDSQITALTAFCAELPAPVQVWPSSPDRLDVARRGEVLFQEVGCAECHPAKLGDVEGIYSDLCLHDMKRGVSQEYEMAPLPKPSGVPDRDEWKTPPLWGVADTAPYMHDGGATTLEGAILAHSGEAAPSIKLLKSRGQADMDRLVAFLKTLRTQAH